MTRQNKKSDKISLIALYLKGRKADLIARSDEVATSYLLQANQPFSVLGHRFVECVAGVHFLLEVVGELLGNFRVVTGELLVAVFGVDVFCNRNRRLLGVENKGSLAFGSESRVVTEQGPVTGIHSHLLVCKLAVEIETVVDAGAVADDQRRTVVCFRFLENLQGLSVVCAEGDTTDVNVLVAHGDEAEVLLAGALTSGSEEGNCATVRGLGSLSTGVGVDFCIEDADVHIFTGCHHVVETTVTDVVCPTVTTEDPHGLLHEIVGEFVAEADGCFVGSTGEGSLQGGNVFTLGLDAGFVVLLLGRELFLEFGRNVHGFEEAESLLGMLRDSEAHTETEFGVVFEE